MEESYERILDATACIVTAWLDANAVLPQALPGLIRDVHHAVAGLEPFQSTYPVAGAGADIGKSVFHDHLVCLEDGRSVTMLKRHLRTAHNLTPEQYRAKWNLPAHYPMVAPEFAKTRSRLAKDSRLGKHR